MKHFKCAVGATLVASPILLALGVVAATRGWLIALSIIATVVLLLAVMAVGGWLLDGCFNR